MIEPTAVHSYGAYSRGACQCPVCREAAKLYRREQRARRLQALQANPDHEGHGKRAGYDCGCRCERCCEARIRIGNKRRRDQYVGWPA